MKRSHKRILDLLHSGPGVLLHEYQGQVLVLDMNRPFGKRLLAEVRFQTLEDMVAAGLLDRQWRVVPGG